MKGMGKKLLTCFLFILCTHAVSILARTSVYELEHEHGVQGRKIHVRRAGVGGSVNVYGETYGTDDSRKNQRGKGANGGADVGHRRPTEKSSATPVLARSQQPFLITKTMLQVTSALILVLPFHLL